MSKLETVKALGASSQQQLQIVESIQQLQSAMEQVKSLPETVTVSVEKSLEPLIEAEKKIAAKITGMQSSMESLPSAVATEIAEGLEPLTRIRQDVRVVLESYEKVMEAQRRSLDELATEMSRQAAIAFTAKVESLDKPLKELAESVKPITAVVGSLHQLPGRLTSAAAGMDTASQQIMEAAKSIQPPLWKRLATLSLVAILAGAAGSIAVETGQAVSNRLVLPSAEQQELESFRKMWRNATPKERELLKQIANRPAN